MPVDVETAVFIARRRSEVAAYAGDPDNAPEWYENIRSIEWQSQRPMRVGSKLAFVAEFLGRRLVQTQSRSTAQRVITPLPSGGSMQG